MDASEDCNKKALEKLCSPEEANLLWDEYKYRHDLIWKHVIRSTVAVIILITVPYSTDLIYDKYLVGGASVAAVLYLCHTLWVIYREHELLVNVKNLHRQRQRHYLRLRQGKCFDWANARSGGFLGRILLYFVLLYLAVIFAVIAHTNLKEGVTIPALKRANISLGQLIISGITVSDLTEPDMTVDKVKSRIEESTDKISYEISESKGIEAITAAIDRLTLAIGQQTTEPPRVSSPIAKNKAQDSCSKLETFLNDMVPIFFGKGKDQPLIGENIPLNRDHNAIRNLNRYLTENPDVYITIEGHTDGSGSDRFNSQLGRDRAIAVKRILSPDKDVQKRVFVVSYGEQRAKTEGSAGHDNEQFRNALIKAARIFDGQCLKVTSKPSRRQVKPPDKAGKPLIASKDTLRAD